MLALCANLAVLDHTSVCCKLGKFFPRSEVEGKNSFLQLLGSHLYSKKNHSHYSVNQKVSTRVDSKKQGLCSHFDFSPLAALLCSHF